MKVVEYAYEVRTRIQLTEAEIYHLIDLALSHYDYKCKSAGRAGPGGFLNGFKNSLRSDNTSDFWLTFDELGILNKILEQPSADPGLREAARQILRDVGEEAARIDLIMKAVHNRKPFEDAPYQVRQCETLVLTLEEIRTVRDRVFVADTRDRFSASEHMAWIARGVTASYWDQCGGDTNGTQMCLTQREIMGLLHVLQGHPLQATVQQALTRLLTQPKTEP